MYPFWLSSLITLQSFGVNGLLPYIAWTKVWTPVFPCTSISVQHLSADLQSVSIVLRIPAPWADSHTSSLKCHHDNKRTYVLQIIFFKKMSAWPCALTYFCHWRNPSITGETRQLVVPHSKSNITYFSLLANSSPSHDMLQINMAYFELSFPSQGNKRTNVNRAADRCNCTWISIQTYLLG